MVRCRCFEARMQALTDCQLSARPNGGTYTSPVAASTSAIHFFFSFGVCRVCRVSRRSECQYNKAWRCWAVTWWIFLSKVMYERRIGSMATPSSPVWLGDDMRRLSLTVMFLDDIKCQAGNIHLDVMYHLAINAHKAVNH